MPRWITTAREQVAMTAPCHAGCTSPSELVRTIAETLGVSVATVYRIVAED